MENEYQLDELLVRYLSSETNSEENRMIQGWLSKGPENQQYFDRLQNTWHLMSVKHNVDFVDIDNEWLDFLKLTERNDDIHNEITIPKTVLEDEKLKRINYFSIMKIAGVAAACILTFLIGFILINQNSKEIPLVFQPKVQREIKPGIVYRKLINNSGRVINLTLEEGSQVVIFDGSELSYREHFLINKRELTLKGKAEFKVAKDAKRPFIVYSDDLSTTALGTQFLVVNKKEQPSIVIRLKEGKIRIESTTSAKRKLDKLYFLVPGQELIYNKENATVLVRKIISEKTVTPISKKEKSQPENPSVPKKAGSWYMFNNQSLLVIFTQLQNMYGVEIRFSKEDVNNLYFIGKFDKSESLENVLHEIADINNLNVRKEQNAFVITK